MRSILGLAFIACLASCINNELFTRTSTFPENQENLGVFDGKKTNIKKHPYQTSILLDGKVFCSGVIVNDRWVCTTADCVNGIILDHLAIVAESDDGMTGRTFSISKVVEHPQYRQSPPLDYNFACIQINGTFKWSAKCKPAKLPSKPAVVDSKMSVAGWGDTSLPVGSAAKNHLFGGFMTWQSADFCKKTYSGLGFNWTPRLACAYNKGKTTLCQGDWGAPFIYGGVYYGSFSACATKGFCSSEAYPAILCNASIVAPWLSHTTGASYDLA